MATLAAATGDNRPEDTQNLREPEILEQRGVQEAETESIFQVDGYIPNRTEYVAARRREISRCFASVGMRTSISFMGRGSL